MKEKTTGRSRALKNVLPGGETEVSAFSIAGWLAAIAAGCLLIWKLIQGYGDTASVTAHGIAAMFAMIAYVCDLCLIAISLVSALVQTGILVRGDHNRTSAALRFILSLVFFAGSLTVAIRFPMGV